MKTVVISYRFILFPGLIVAGNCPVLSLSVVIIKGHSVVVPELPSLRIGKYLVREAACVQVKSTNPEVTLGFTPWGVMNPFEP